MYMREMRCLPFAASGTVVLILSDFPLRLLCAFFCAPLVMNAFRPLYHLTAVAGPGSCQILDVNLVT